MTEEKDMPGFYTYKEAAIIFALLPKEDAANAIQAACNYYLYGQVADLQGMAGKVFEIEKAAIDRGRVAYEEQRRGGKKGADKRYGRQT